MSINTQPRGRFWARLWRNKEITAFARRFCPAKEKYRGGQGKTAPQRAETVPNQHIETAHKCML